MANSLGPLDFPAYWDSAPESSYWKTTLEQALQPDNGHRIGYDCIDTSSDDEVEAISGWYTVRNAGGITSQAYDRPQPGKVHAGYEHVTWQEQVTLSPLTAKEASLPCEVAFGEAGYVGIHFEPRLVGSLVEWLQRVLLPALMPEEVLRGWIVPSRLAKVGMLDYLRQCRNIDVGSALANLATAKWISHSLLTRNTDHCVRRCAILPRPTGFIHQKGEPLLVPGSTSLPVIENPYCLPPRRLWDLVHNRVVDVDIFAQRYDNGAIDAVRMPAEGYWAITHSWTQKMERWMTPVNNYRWPVPLPPGVELEHIRREALRAGAVYCWLDVVCLRQRMMQENGPDEINEKRRLQEWSIDIPTIGNIYRQATHVLRYFNGLGRRMELTGWDAPYHWINRA